MPGLGARVQGWLGRAGGRCNADAGAAPNLFT
jgi:hypothetical protein